MVEQWPLKPLVEGSSPSRPTILRSPSRQIQGRASDGRPLLHLILKNMVFRPEQQKPEKTQISVPDSPEKLKKRQAKPKKEKGWKVSGLETQVTPAQVEAAKEAYDEMETEKLGTAQTQASGKITGVEKTVAARPEKIAEKKKTTAEKEPIKTEITTEDYFKKVLTEVTHDLFENSIKHGMIAAASGHLERAHTENLPEYEAMKTKFIGYIDTLMKKENIALEYRVELQVLKSNVESDSFDFVTGPELIMKSKEISKKDQERFSTIMKTSEIQSIPDIFERRIADEDIVGSYQTLAKAFQYKNKLPEGEEQYEEMKNLFLLSCSAQIEMPDNILSKKAIKSLKKTRKNIENDIYK